jgi:hypothetical protein
MPLGLQSGLVWEILTMRGVAGKACISPRDRDLPLIDGHGVRCCASAARAKSDACLRVCLQ